MRGLIVVSLLCLTSTPAFACVFNTDCNPGATCVAGVCSDARQLSNDDNAPAQSQTPRSSKSCFDNSDCTQGAICVKGSGLRGVCIGH
jgi:hypothetical protein